MKHLPRKQHLELLYHAKDIVSHIESDKNYSCFYLKNGKRILMSYTLSTYQGALESSFIRINRSVLINKSEIVQISNNGVRTNTGGNFIISRRRISEVLKNLSFNA
ncbi:MAG TPA: LytTR family DNA-binding domain-containing protein [Leadbetterella sp.]|nr:LytTR family DNA-binding domain-containing protein [Leadbetterella sp.]